MSVRERGEGKVGLIIFLALLAAGIFFLVKWIPPRVNAYEFKDEMEKWNTDPDLVMRRALPDTVRDELMKKARALDLPIRKEDLKIDRDGNTLYISVVIDIPIDLKVMTIKQHYEFKEPKS